MRKRRSILYVVSCDGRTTTVTAHNPGHAVSKARKACGFQPISDRQAGGWRNCHVGARYEQRTASLY